MCRLWHWISSAFWRWLLPSEVLTLRDLRGSSYEDLMTPPADPSAP